MYAVRLHDFRLNLCLLIVVIVSDVVAASLETQLAEANANAKKIQTSLDSANSILEQGDASLANVRKAQEETANKHAAELSAVNTELNEERYTM